MPNALDVPGMMQMYPLFIAVFMVMTSLFNKDVKGIVWLGCAILGVVFTHGISKFFDNTPLAGCKPKSTTELLSSFKSYTNLSTSSFFIAFTLVYLLLPMQHNNDWNYYVILGFLSIYLSDVVMRKEHFCVSNLGIFSGTLLGAMFSLLCYTIIRTAGGDKLLYFNTVSSNNIYCSKPKKQTFKCYVYKNGEIVSALN